MRVSAWEQMDSVPLDRFHDLPGGARVRGRLPRLTDPPALLELAARRGIPMEELEARRALRSVVGRRVVLCATVWEEQTERVVGVAAADLASDGRTVLCDEDAYAGLCDLHERALDEQATAWRRRVA